MMGPMATNPLTELIPAQYRKYVYVVAAAAVFVYGLWEASNGDIRAFVVSVVTALVAGLAASNTSGSDFNVDDFEDPDTFYDGHAD